MSDSFDESPLRGAEGVTTDLYVLDTSAIFTYTDQEEGVEEVERLFRAAQRNECRLEACSISLMEIYYISLREQGEDDAISLIALVKAWPIDWVYPDEKTLLQAGRLKASYRMSLADALIAAVAKLHNATLVNKDPEMELLAGEIALLGLPFKRTL